MDSLSFNRLSMPIITGTPQTAAQKPLQNDTAAASTGVSFQELLQSKLASESGVAFSKHAVKRVVERGIDLTENSLERLDRGIKIAQEKGMEDTLILIDATAFIVSVKNNKVITTVSGNELQGNAFTNIDGAVII